MGWTNIATRTTDDTNSPADINQLMENQRVLSGNGTLAPEKSITDLINEKSYVKQIVPHHVNTAYNYAISTTRATATELSCLTKSITTSMDNTQIAIDINMMGEGDNNITFILERGINGVYTEIGSAANPGNNQMYGIAVMPYDSQNDTTPSIIPINYIDNPMQVAGTVITYRLRAYNTYASVSLYINRSVTDANLSYEERITSNVRLTEFGGTVASVAAGTVTVADESYIKQIADHHVVDTYTYTTTTSKATAPELVCLTTAITLRATDSKVAIDVNITGEAQQGTVLYIERGIGGSWTEIGSGTSAGTNRPNGIVTFPYENELTTTPNIVSFQYIDTPGQSAGTAISYRIKAYNRESSGAVIYINRSVNDTDNTYCERLASNMRLTEFAGTPVATMNDTVIASSAEAIAGTNDTKIITPLKLRNGLNASGNAPVYACRAWVNFNGTGTVAIRASGNVSSITDNGTGDYTVNFTTGMEDANYSFQIIAAQAWSISVYSQTTTSLRIGTQANTTYFIDYSNISVAIFR